MFVFLNVNIQINYDATQNTEQDTNQVIWIVFTLVPTFLAHSFFCTLNASFLGILFFSVGGTSSKKCLPIEGRSCRSFDESSLALVIVVSINSILKFMKRALPGLVLSNKINVLRTASSMKCVTTLTVYLNVLQTHV